jgi:hypothetical protein
MATRYYSYDPRAEWEPVERWENEGGRLDQKHDYILDSIGDDYRRHIDVDIQIRKTGKRDDISRVGPLLPSNNQHYQLDRTGRASRAFSLTFMPARMRAVRFEI